MPISAIPAAITALVAVIRGRPGFAAPGDGITDGDWLVFDGPDLRDTDAGRSIVVASATPVDERLATSTLTRGLGRRDELFDVAVSAVAWTGDTTTVQALRQEVFGALAEIDSALLADRSLGGEVIDAHLVRATYRVAQSDTGLAAAADGVIRVHAVSM